MEIDPGPELETAGSYYLISQSDTLVALGLNYNRMESDPASHTPEALREIASGLPGMDISVMDGNTERLTTEVERLRTGTELWRYCLIAVLIFLLAETLLLRIAKKQRA